MRTANGYTARDTVPKNYWQRSETGLLPQPYERSCRRLAVPSTLLQLTSDGRVVQSTVVHLTMRRGKGVKVRGPYYPTSNLPSYLADVLGN